VWKREENVIVKEIKVCILGWGDWSGKERNFKGLAFAIAFICH
jgi:hypothetical protein